MKPIEQINTYRQEIDFALQKIFESRKPKNFFEPIAYPVLAGGKRLRPILLRLSHQIVGGNEKSALTAGLAIELLHTFTLVHDDIMDQDDTRRGNLTVHKKWDEATAILSGDGLVTLAYDTLLTIEHPQIIKIARIFTNGLLVLCEGQAQDKAFENMHSVPMASYETMIHHKTAKLIEVACETGAILANATDTQIHHIKQYAFDLGMAFQIQDDLLDLTGNEKDLGKPIGSDLYQKKKTFMVIHFLEHASNEQKNIFQFIWNKAAITSEDVSEIKLLFKQTGTITDTKQKVQNHLQSAVDHLTCFDDNQSKDILQYLTEKLLHRIS